MMQTFIGTKTLRAMPMNKLDYCKYRGWLVPENEDPTEAGYLVEYTDGGKPNHENHAGYISWSPAAQFEAAYRSTQDGFSFGMAIAALKQGRRISRFGWNGNGMFVYLVPANSYPAQTGVAKAYFGNGSMVPYNVYMAIKEVDDTVSTWAPSCSDTLADDWFISE